MKEFVRTILDYPVKGIQFRDITTLLQDAGHFKQVVDDMTTPWKNKKIDAVLSIESRGFIMAGAIAYFLNAAFIPLRKPHKLPFETYKVSYDLEYGSTEMHIHTDALEGHNDLLIIDDILATGGTALAALELIENFKKLVKEKTGKNFPQDVNEQLIEAISSVFRSWDSQRAKTYRKLNRIPDEWGTAVNVQAMVFGNMGSDCATGVAFTRNPSTGENSFFGEYLINAQGEDVVAGTRTPQYITKKSKKESGSKELSMQEAMPNAYKELEKVFIKLEKHYRDMQDIEFTVENNKLWMLQTRSGKRTAKAGIKIAVDSTKTEAFTYTHLHCDPIHREYNLKAIKDVSSENFTINISVENKNEAKRLKAKNFDVALVDSKLFEQVKNGESKEFFACPAQYESVKDGETFEKSRCIDCKKCSMFNRKEIVVFKED